MLGSLSSSLETTLADDDELFLLRYLSLLGYGKWISVLAVKGGKEGGSTSTQGGISEVHFELATSSRPLSLSLFSQTDNCPSFLSHTDGSMMNGLQVGLFPLIPSFAHREQD